MGAERSAQSPVVRPNAGSPAVSKAALVVGLLSASVSHLWAENRPIDTERSTLTVLVSKSGLFSAFADNHVISAPLLVGLEVLDVAKFPCIQFASTTIDPAGTDRWQVTGHLTIHGQAQTITFPVVRVSATYRGEVAIKQRDFGIEPIKVAGGTVKVKDELRVQFEIVR
jgi:polyisoprenoid-binding protein YceI